jgi:S1-C subfamily serine protease
VAGSGCGVIQEGSGFVAAPGIVVTNAHVVAGIESVFVIDSTGRHPTKTLLFDPRLDIAVLRVPGLAAPPARIDPAVVGRGTTAVVLGYPGGGAFTDRKAGVAAAFQAVGLDIYGTSQTTREIYELDAIVLPGNSGGPLVASGNKAVPDGTVIGVVFARSTTNPQVGYALAMSAVNADITRAETRTTTVGTGGCIS